LIKRVAFPAEVLPLQAILAQQILLLVGLGGFVALTLCTDLWPTPGARLLWLPLLFVLQALFTLGLALATATLHAFLRDTLHVVAMLSTLWMFATPIFWIPSAEVLPGVAPFLPWLEWNPMHAFISCWRQMLMGDAPQEAFTGSFMTSLAHATAWTAVALACGSFLFALGERRLPDEI
jgi:lipopolysaccharide transport system permease protein